MSFLLLLSFLALKYVKIRRGIKIISRITHTAVQNALVVENIIVCLFYQGADFADS